jgi:hypothetical protein
MDFFLPFRVWNTRSHGYWIYILWNRTLEFKCDFKKGLIPLQEAAEQLTKIVIGDLCLKIGASFFAKKMKRNIFILTWKLLLAHIHLNQIKLVVLSISSSPNIKSFVFTSDKTNLMKVKKCPQIFMHTFGTHTFKGNSVLK